MGPEEDILSGLAGISGMVLDVALHGMATCSRPDPLVAQVHDLIRDLAWSSGALDLSLAWLGCHIQAMDLRPLGYGSFSAFVREEMDWQPARQRELARLLRSGLDLVQRAVALRIVPLTTAAKAPGRMAPDQQEAWLQAISMPHGDDAGDDQPTAVLAGQDAVTVRRARELMRLLLGTNAPDSVCDRKIVECWKNGDTTPELLEMARKPPAAPDLSPPQLVDEALQQVQRLVGPIEPPRDLDHALEMVKKVQVARQQRRAVLGQLLDQVAYTWFFLDWGHDSFDEFVRNDLGLSVRSAQRLRKLGRTLCLHPDLAQAIDQGLSLDRTEAIGRLVDTGHAARRWLAIAPHLPKQELLAATRKPAAWDPPTQAAAYEALIEESTDLVARAMAARHATETSGAGPTLGTTDPSRIRVARHPDDPDCRARALSSYIIVPENLLVASQWLLENVDLPAQHGYGSVKDRQHHICQNPECRKRSLRNHAHHDHERSKGGGDDDWNLRCLCKSCHLRLRHGGYMDVVRVDDAHVYLFPGRAVVVR